MVNMPNTRRLTKRSRPKEKKKKKIAVVKIPKPIKKTTTQIPSRGRDIDMCPLCHEDDKELHPILCGNNHHFCKPCIARHLLIKPTGVNRTTIKCPLL
jgi:hypothetical protein